MRMPMETNRRSLHIAVIEDDAEDYFIFKTMLSKIPHFRFHLECAPTYEQGLETLRRGAHDIYFLDYHLGIKTGLDLMEEAVGGSSQAPIIFLTGRGDHAIDVQAMHGGASDYLVKGKINPEILERTIRYNLERKRSEASLRHSREQLRHLSIELLRAQEKERKRIAMELHDSVGQMLTALKFGMEAFFDELDESTRERTGEAHRNLVSIIQQTIGEVSNISTNLRPSVLDNLDVGSAVLWFCGNFAAAFPHIKVERHAELNENELEEDLKITVFRILQESLNNAAKHSQASVIRVLLQGSAEDLVLVVEDDGKGFDPKRLEDENSRRMGMGLLGMRERAELFGGTLSIDSAPGKGTVIKASWAL